jgi:hypothetical protein
VCATFRAQLFARAIRALILRALNFPCAISSRTRNFQARDFSRTQFLARNFSVRVQLGWAGPVGLG